MQALFQHPHSLRLGKRSAFLSFYSFRRSREMGDISTHSEGVEKEGVVEIAAVARNPGTLRRGGAWCDAFAEKWGQYVYWRW